MASEKNPVLGIRFLKNPTTLVCHVNISNKEISEIHYLKIHVYMWTMSEALQYAYCRSNSVKYIGVQFSP